MSLHDELTDLFGEICCFGLDIGTTCSYVAYKEKDSTPKIPSYRGVCQGGIPSLAWRDRDGKEWFCDQVAEKQGMAEDPAGVWSSGKMKLKDQEVILNGHSYTPRYLLRKQIQRVLAVSRDALEQEMIEMDPKEWVVGVPARFTAAEKGELQFILEEATGGKKIRLVLEPILAAVTNDYYTRKFGRKPRPVLVLDMGGGTFDVVLLIPNPNPTPDNPEPYIAREPDGLREAGDSHDAIVEQLILDKVRSNPGSVKLEILENPDHYDRRRLRQIARETKERLSGVDSCAVNITGVECGSTIVTITRKEYEALIRPSLQKAVDLAAEVLNRCKLGSNPDIDILLVGGATYTPLLRTLLEKKFSWLDPKNIMQRFPEKAVALGAAIYAETPELVRPKVAYGYAVNTHIDGGRKEVLRVIIPSAANLPATVEANFRTLDPNQHAVKFSVYEVENSGDKIHMEMDQGRITVYNISHWFHKRVSKGTSVKLTTTLTEDGVLTMTVEDFQSEKKVTRKTFTMTNTVSD